VRRSLDTARGWVCRTRAVKGKFVGWVFMLPSPTRSPRVLRAWKAGAECRWLAQQGPTASLRGLLNNHPRQLVCIQQLVHVGEASGAGHDPSRRPVLYILRVGGHLPNGGSGLWLAACRHGA